MDFEKLRHYRNERNGFARKLGIQVEEIRLGYAKAVKTVLDDETNPFGAGHGGVAFTLADMAAGAASSAHGRISATVNADYQYLHPYYAGDVLTAEASECKSGRTLCVYEVRIKNQEEKLVGMGTYTFFLREEELHL